MAGRSEAGLLGVERDPAGMAKGMCKVGLQQDADGVRIQFSDQPDVHASFVVAADGYFSPAREIVLDDGAPEFQVLW